MLTAAYLENLPTEVVQPDGTVLHLLSSGDEFANRLHDTDGYTIIQSRTDGYFYYAEKAGEELIPSTLKPGDGSPSTRSIVPNLNISEAEYKARAEFMRRHGNPEIRTPQTGTVNNLCILIRFSDQTEFAQPRSYYEEKFNSVEENSASQRNYFRKASYNQLDIITAFYPSSPPDLNLSYLDSHPRNYYVPYNPVTNPIGYQDSYDRTYREHTLLANAVTAVASQIPASLNIDADNDGYVDNVCFVIRGPHTAWAELLWAHRWALYSTDAYINGKLVWDFTFQPENQNEVRTICHEMFHSIGAPDLYHYTFNGVSPVGCWDIMESGFGHMGAYIKMKYGGWLPPAEELMGAGTYTLNPVTSPTNSLYKIDVPGQPGEAIYLEYRKKGSDVFEQNLPDSGLLIYRVNSYLNGNSDGPPDEVYIYRPNGTATVNGDIALANFSAENYRTEFNDFTNPNCILLNGSLAHIKINSISQCGETISFFFDYNMGVLPPQITSVYPADGQVLTTTNHIFSATASAYQSTVTQVTFSLDGIPLSTDSEAPYNCEWVAGEADAGYHELVVAATTSSGQISSRRSRFRVVDPQQQNWFTWTTDNPVYASYGRGTLPIQVAIDLDLGDEDYVVKGLAVHLEDDIWGNPAVPGLVSAKINRFANGLITTQTLLSLGDFVVPYGSHQEIEYENPLVLNGKIALIINLYEYQKIRFDINGIIGHTWLTEPDRPWTDALGRGMLGAADIGLKLQSPYVGNPEITEIPVALSISCYPNPFSGELDIVFSMPKDAQTNLAVYNIKGQKVKTLLAGTKTKGNHAVKWDGSGDNGAPASTGIYLIRLQSGSGKPLILKAVKTGNQ